MRVRERFEYFTTASRNALFVHGILSAVVSGEIYRAVERNYFNPDLNPFLYATAHTSVIDLWRILVRREPKFVDNLGIFAGSAAGYTIAYYLFG